MTAAAFSPGRNGVYRAPDDGAALRAAAVAAGLRWTPLELQRVRGKRALLDAFALGLVFPPTFGGNLDALADCLQDLSWLPEQGVVVLLQGAAGSTAFAANRAALLEILGAAAQYWQQRGRVFIVLLAGDSGLPSFLPR